jgi:polyribonucleotide nucleotidyltransferase
MNVVEVSVDFGGRPLTLQTGKLAKQADASVLATYGDTMVLVTVVSSKTLKPDQDFFPLTVDYQEKYYAAGRIPGGFFKREARPSERATLSARLIDRPHRPLFPEDYLCETNVVATILSVDPNNEPDIVASIATSAAFHISDIPFNGPVGTVRVGSKDGKFVCNLPPSEQGDSECDMLVSGVRTGVVMVEGAAKEISEQKMMDAIDFAHQQMQAIFDMQDDLRKKVGKPKREYPKAPRDADFKKKIRTAAWGGLEKAFAIREKLARYTAMDEVKKAIETKFKVAEPKSDEDKIRNSLIKLYIEETKSEFARELTLESKHRIDGRKYDDIRKITCEIGLLPRVHGSAVFTRGETQVLAAITLGTADDEQKVDSVSGTSQKSFMLHYNFPPFSVGEARPLRPPGRREIGHGFLAERALQYIIPPKDRFPYTIRLVSEVLESNGSSSMATVCSGSMALMQAGVPIPKPVAGVAMGLIKEGEKFAVLSDILGDEDHLGDMDFKVCGTDSGITAFQMDLKIGGISRDIMELALEQARQGRLHVLEKMNACISEPVKAVSRYAPRIFTLKVKPEKVREIIGSGGKVIRSIIERTGVKIDIEDDGSVNIASADETSAQKAIDIINQIIAEPEIGAIYEGKVTRIADFGAFVEIFPGTDGLCHISELEHTRVRRVEDVVSEGEIIKVKCLDVDAQGKIRLSRKALLPKGQPPAGGPSDDSGGTGFTPAPEASEDEPQPARVTREASDDDIDDNVGNRVHSDRGGDREARHPRGERSDRGEPGNRGREGGGYREGGHREGGHREGGHRSRERSDSEGGGGRSGGGRHSRGGGGGSGGGRRFGGHRSGGGDRDRGPAQSNRHSGPRRDGRPDRGPDRGMDNRGPDRNLDRADRPERMDRPERNERPERGPERGPDRGSDRGPDRGDRFNSRSGGDRMHASDRGGEREWQDRPARAERPERPERAERPAPREQREPDRDRELDRVEPWEERPYLYDDED